MYRVLGIAAVSGLVLLSVGGSVAEDRDEFYAITREASAQRLGI